MVRKTKYDFYDDWFKATAVELGALPGVQAQDVAEVLDIHPIMLYRWKKEFGMMEVSQTKRLRELEKENGARSKALRRLRKRDTHLRHSALFPSPSFSLESSL